MDKADILRRGKRNVIGFCGTAIAALGIHYWQGEFGFAFGAIFGASMFAIYFQADATKTFLLLSDLLEQIKATSEQQP